MKLATQKIQLGLIFLLLTGASSAYSKDLPKGQVMPEASGSSNLTLTVDGLRNIEGVLRIGIYNSETGHSTQQAIGGANAPVTSEAVVVTFEGLAEGQYAINLFHDVDNNGQMNTNLFGIPSEPYAFSNNAKGSFGPAKWKDAVFEVSTGMSTHTITMFK